MKILEWSKINTEDKYMNEVSGKIVAIKTEVHEQNWETTMFECQQSRLAKLIAKRLELAHTWLTTKKEL